MRQICIMYLGNFICKPPSRVMDGNNLTEQTDRRKLKFQILNMAASHQLTDLNLKNSPQEKLYD